MQAFISNQYRLTLFLCIALLFSCTKDENAEKDYPRLDTNEVTSIGSWGALASGKIISGNLSSITEYGFVWSTDEYPDAEQDDRQFKTGAPSGLAFSDTIHSSLKLNVTYYLRAYVKTDQQVVQGNIVTFKSLGSLAPTITGFTPKAGTWGDTVRITGRYFGTSKKGLQVKLGNYIAPVIARTGESIDFVIPPGQFSEQMLINVSVDGTTILSETNFTFLQPIVSSISPLTAIFDDTLTVVGTNFSRLKSVPHIYINDYPARTIYASREMLKVVVPQQLTEQTNTIIIIGPATRRAFSPLTLKGIELISFTPDTVFTGNETLTITACNLSPLPGNNMVLINGARANIISYSANTLKVSLPSNVIPDKFVSSQTSVPVMVVRGSEQRAFAQHLYVHWRSQWKRVNNFPGVARMRAIGFAVNNKGYMGMGVLLSTNEYSNELWEYDLENDRWSAKAPFPDKGRIYPSSFVIGNRAYVGLGSSNSLTDTRYFHNDFYSYSPFSNTWNKMADYPGEARVRPASFVDNDQAYVGTGTTTSRSDDSRREFWNFDPLSNQWSPSLRFTEPAEMAHGFSVAGKGYLYNEHKIYQFNKTSWEFMAEAPMGFDPFGYPFTIGQSAYLASFALWEFNSETPTVNRLDMPVITPTSVFVINGRACFVTTNNQVWLFDPKGMD